MAELGVTRVASFVDRQKAAMIVGYVDVATGTGGYGAGGWDLAITTVNPNVTTIYDYNIHPVLVGSVIYEFIWDHATGHLEAYECSDGTEAPADGTLNSLTLRLKYEGI